MKLLSKPRTLIALLIGTASLLAIPERLSNVTIQGNLAPAGNKIALVAGTNSYNLDSIVGTNKIYTPNKFNLYAMEWLKEYSEAMLELNDAQTVDGRVLKNQLDRMGDAGYALLFAYVKNDMFPEHLETVKYVANRSTFITEVELNLFNQIDFNLTSKDFARAKSANEFQRMFWKYVQQKEMKQRFL